MQQGFKFLQGGRLSAAGIQFGLVYKRSMFFRSLLQLLNAELN